MLIDLLRHGEAVGGRRYRGQVDDPLSDKGWLQMRQAVASQPDWQVIVTSPLRRCAEFAAELGRQHQLPVVTDDRLKETAFGSWEGKTVAEIEALGVESVAQFLQDPVRHRPQGAEQLDDFSRRVIQAWHHIITTYHDQHVLIVTHAGVIRVVTAYVLGMPMTNMYRLQVANAAINRIEIRAPQPPRLILHNGRL